MSEAGRHSVLGLAGVFIRARDPAALAALADLDGLVAQLRAGGVAVDEDVKRSEYGAFGWCVDGEGNRVESWQPPD